MVWWQMAPRLSSTLQPALSTSCPWTRLLSLIFQTPGPHDKKRQATNPQLSLQRKNPGDMVKVEQLWSNPVNITQWCVFLRFSLPLAFSVFFLFCFVFCPNVFIKIKMKTEAETCCGETFVCRWLDAFMSILLWQSDAALKTKQTFFSTSLKLTVRKSNVSSTIKLLLRKMESWPREFHTTFFILPHSFSTCPTTHKLSLAPLLGFL